MARRCLLVAALLALAAGPAYAQNVYFGNLHSHTSYSDGSGTPAEAFAQAKASGLDFFAITEHNHDKGDGKGARRDGLMIATAPGLYNGNPASLLATAASHSGPQFVALYGQEFSTISAGNHVNIFDVAEVIPTPNGQFDDLLVWAATHPDSSGGAPLMQFNHPRAGVGEPHDYGRDKFQDERLWVQKMDAVVELIEVLNAPALKDGQGFRTHHHEREYFGYLNMGFHLAPSVGHDNHFRNWGTSTDARVAVLAPELTKAALLSALKARHAYATEDKNLRVIFRANGALSGDIAPPPAPDAELDLTLELNDPDEPAAAYRVDVFIDEPGGAPAKQPVETFRFAGNTNVPVRLDGVRFTRPGAFVLVRITQSAELEDEEHEAPDDRAWTAPVWFEFPSDAVPALAAPQLRIASILANPVGDDMANEQVTIVNAGTAAADLQGWQLRDLAENVWDLSALGSLAPGQSATVTRQGQPMSLNNAGDSIELLDPAGVPVHGANYASVAEGQVITVAP